MTVDLTYSIAVVLIVAAVTFLTRAAPFALQNRAGMRNGWVTYLGKTLPPAIMAMLVVYGLKNTGILRYPNGIPELIALAVVAVLHVWKKNALISILSGTAVYMILVQRVFTGG